MKEKVYAELPLYKKREMIQIDLENGHDLKRRGAGLFVLYTGGGIIAYKRAKQGLIEEIENTQQTPNLTKTEMVRFQVAKKALTNLENYSPDFGPGAAAFFVSPFLAATLAYAYGVHLCRKSVKRLQSLG